MSDENDLLNPDNNDLIPKEYQSELLGKEAARSRQAQELDVQDSDLIPADDVHSETAPRPLSADEIDSALGKVTISKPVDLGGGLRIEPFIGRPRAGSLVTKDGESVGNLSTLSSDDLEKIRGFLEHPEKFNDLIPGDDDFPY